MRSMTWNKYRQLVRSVLHLCENKDEEVCVFIDEVGRVRCKRLDCPESVIWMDTSPIEVLATYKPKVPLDYLREDYTAFALEKGWQL